jgi:hypothetical protein
VRVRVLRRACQTLLSGLLVGMLGSLPESARAEGFGAAGFGPFPVRNFQALNLLVMGMPGERLVSIWVGPTM